MLKRPYIVAITLVLSLVLTKYAISNEFYTHGNFPSPSSPATSASMRAEFDLISTGFDKLPTLTGNANRAVVVNAGGSGLTVTTGSLSLGGNLTITGAFNTVLAQQASTTLTLPPVSGTLATLAGTETLSSKTLVSPSISNPGFSGTATGSLTNLQLTSPIFSSITNGGTLTLPTGTDTLIGRGTTDTLTNKTYSNPIFSGTASGSLTNLALTTPTLTSASLTNAVLTTSTVAADPTAALGIASKQYVDALWTTGDVKLTLKTSADSGWVLMNDGTIGSATSGATTRANADTSTLYTLIWTNCVDQWCAVTGGRGASAAADFAANKPLALPKTLGRALAGYGTGVVSASGADADVDIGAAESFTVASNNTKWITGMPVVFTLTSGTITGLTSGNTYYIIRSSATLVQLASSLANAQNGTAINMTAKSSPVWTLTHTYTARVMGEAVGEESHAMDINELLAHTHTMNAVQNVAGAVVAAGADKGVTANTASRGGNVAMNQLQPTLFLNVMVKL